WVSVSLGNVLSLIDRDQDARRFADNALRLSRALPDPALEAVTKLGLAVMCFNTGDPATCVRIAREASRLLQGELRLARLGQVIIPSLQLHSFLARGLAQLGDFEEGVRHGRAAIEIAESTGDRYGMSVAWIALGHLHSERGDVDQARLLLERALGLCRDLGLPFYGAVASFLLGELHVRTGPVGGAVRFIEEASEVFRASGRAWDGLIVPAMAEARLHAGQFEEARALAERALAWAQARGERGWEPLVLRVLGLVAASVDSPNVATAERHLESALVVASEYGRRPL